MDVKDIEKYCSCFFKASKVLAPGESVFTSDSALIAAAKEVLAACNGKNRLQWTNKTPTYLKKIINGGKLTQQEAEWLLFEWQQSYADTLSYLTEKMMSIINTFL